MADLALQESRVQNAAKRQYFAEFKDLWQLTLDLNIRGHQEGLVGRSSLG
ncbi:MAG: hypothetical protein VYC36_09565 [Pseudomonadota bacterium]|nr:hypothetical protein [Pseudomonadota bacterium]